MTKSRIEDVFKALRTLEFEQACAPHSLHDGTVKRIVREINLSDPNVRKQLHKLHSQGRSHIAMWTEQHPVAFSRAPIWVAGPGEHVPEPKGSADRRREGDVARARDRRQQERRDEGAQRRATYQFIERLKQQPQTWLSPLEMA